MGICYRAGAIEGIHGKLSGPGEKNLFEGSTTEGTLQLYWDNNLSGREDEEDRTEERGADPREKILALYNEYRPRLFRYMRSLNLGRDQADEVIQETFMRLTAELVRQHEIENVQGWIVRVAHNLAVTLHQRQRMPVLAENGHAVLENRPDPALSPEEIYSKKERVKRMKYALTQLKPEHRQCFQMRAQGFRYKDIGDALGISGQRAAFVVKQVAVHLASICG
jgi:RNA polymerase sigma-70 factor (ECF subfamily)